MHMSESILQSTIELINNNYCKFGAEETPLYFRMNSSSIKLVKNKLNK